MKNSDFNIADDLISEAYELIRQAESALDRDLDGWAESLREDAKTKLSDADAIRQHMDDDADCDYLNERYSDALSLLCRY